MRRFKLRNTKGRTKAFLGIGESAATLAAAGIQAAATAAAAAMQSRATADAAKQQAESIQSQAKQQAQALKLQNVHPLHNLPHHLQTVRQSLVLLYR